MQIAQVVGGFAPGKADSLRSAMSKKKASEMDALKVEFIEGARAKGTDPGKAEALYDLMAKFAEYAFNKSHSAAYAFVAYQTAYLKAHYPAEFMAANLSSELDDISRIEMLMDECRGMGLRVFGPDVNVSGTDFRAKGGAVYAGLAAVKNVGLTAALEIIGEREKNGPFKTVFDFTGRVNLQCVNRRAMEALVCAGAMDSFGHKRAALFAGIEGAMAYGVRVRHNRETGQTSMFGGGEAGAAGPDGAFPSLPEAEPWLWTEVLKKEKEHLGFYLSGNPLDEYECEIRSFSSLLRLTAVPVNPKDRHYAGGVVNSVQRKTYGENKRMAAVKLESTGGARVEVLVFDREYENLEPYLVPDAIVLFRGKAEAANGQGFKLIADGAIPAAEISSRMARSLHVRLRAEGLDTGAVGELRALCGKHPGPNSFILHTVARDGSEYAIRANAVRVGTGKGFVGALSAIAGRENVWMESR
jgi:DNA polymerase III subunit alpha